MQKLSLCLMLLFFAQSLPAMKQGQVTVAQTYFDRLSPDLQEYLFKFMPSETIVPEKRSTNIALWNLQIIYGVAFKNKNRIGTIKSIVKDASKQIINDSDALQEFKITLQAQEHIPEFKHVEITQWFDAEIKRLQNERELREAVALGDVESVRNLLAVGVNVNAEDKSESTALIKCTDRLCLSEESEKAFNTIFTLLIDAGANVNAQDDHGISPLQNASFHASPFKVEQLLARKANPNISSGMGTVPLLAACRGIEFNLTCAPSELQPRFKKVIELLLVAGADPNKAGSIDKCIKHCLLSSAERGELIELLKKHGWSYAKIDKLKFGQPREPLL